MAQKPSIPKGLAKIFAFCFYNSLSIKYLQNIYKS